MDFLKEFSKQFTNVARSVSGAPKENPEAAKLNGDLKAARAALKELYARYGEACFALQEGKGNRDEAEALALRVRATLLQVEELTRRQEANRELKRCLNCGAVFPKEARFCSACGKKLPEEMPKPEPVEAGEYCPGGGAKRENGEARCPVCGAPFEPEAPAEEPPRPAPAPEYAGPDVEEPDDTDVE